MPERRNHFFDDAKGEMVCLTHLPLPTGHSNIYEPPGISDPLLSTAFRSVIDELDA